MQTAEERPRPGIYESMHASHAQLDRELDRLIIAVEAGDPDIRTLWDRVEGEILAHLDAEERFVLPSFARVDLAEAAQLLHEHGRIRELLMELGVAIDLHYARVAMCVGLVELLRAHADREQRFLYRWAATCLHPELLRATVDRVSDFELVL